MTESKITIISVYQLDKPLNNDNKVNQFMILFGETRKLAEANLFEFDINEFSNLTDRAKQLRFLFKLERFLNKCISS